MKPPRDLIPSELRPLLDRGEILALGAESLLIKHDWLGLPAVYKIRLPKSYRHPRLDERLRRARTRREARALTRLPEWGVPTPALYEVDLERCLIVMEHLPGETLRELTERDFRPRLFEELGRLVGRMHERGFVHYDLTTSNVLIVDGQPHVIDLGLSEDTTDPEDHAIDLRVFERCLESTHPDVREEAWEAFLRGYREERGEGATDTVLERLEDVKGRVRYV
ncbi:Kae1-associated kinase Bud32 [Methanopyrus sp.]